ncbi:MAG: hypothetical protein EXS35_04790 [Pedosphaera sp.]|nr:hypothetical protein [Pedosphaera sp.]
MPIRLNLLAEVQALEEMRRRDPVKRAIWLGCLAVVGMLVWSSCVWVKTMAANRKLGSIENQIGHSTNEYRLVMESQNKVDATRKKLAQLHKLASSRFLQGNLLNALQQITVDDVQLTHLAVRQEYLFTDEVKSKTNDDKVIPGKPATVKENITVLLEAKDASADPGGQVAPFKDAFATNTYFQTMLGKTNGVKLINVSPLTQPGPNDVRPFKSFPMEARYPERIR